MSRMYPYGTAGEAWANVKAELDEADRRKRAHWVEMYPYTDTRGNRRRDFACSGCHCKCAPLEDQEPPTVCPVCHAIMEGIEE